MGNSDGTTNFVYRADTNDEALIRPDFEPYNGDEPYIFVSYSHEDKELVNKIMNVLAREKYRLWYDAGLEVGNDFREELAEKIRNCNVLIFFASNRSFSSKYCSTEIITAFKYEKKIYPFFLGTNSTIEIPIQLEMIIGNSHFIYYDNSEESIRMLIKALPKKTMHALEINYDGVVTKCKDGNNVITIPDYYEGRKVTEIGDEAFRLCHKLEEITFGAYVKSIGNGTFRSCTSITEMLLPERIDFVGENAFRDCINLKKLVIERNIDIFDRAFENCSNLQMIEFPDDFAEVNNAVFNSCKALTQLNLPDSVIMIGESAFADCTGLETLIVPSNTIKINDFAFANCSSINEIVFNNKLKKIGKNAFKNCSSLKSVFIPDSLSLIENGAFKGCKNLEKIDVDPKNKYYRSYENVLFTKNKSELLVYAPSRPDDTYEIPDSVVKICSNAFYGCKNLKEIKIPDSVQILDEGAFFACSNIESIIIPDSVTTIEDFCFRNCTNLRYIEIPDSVRHIGWGIFRGCSFGLWEKEGYELTVVCSDTLPIAEYCDKKGIKRISKKK